MNGVETLACFKRATPLPNTRKLDVLPDPTDVQVHNAYHISWQASDTATMTPQPPALTCQDPIKTWVPGSPVTTSACSTPVNDSNLPRGAGEFLSIGLPIIIVALLVGCFAWCCHSRQKGRKEERALAAARAADRVAARAARATGKLEAVGNQGAAATGGQNSVL